MTDHSPDWKLPTQQFLMHWCAFRVGMRECQWFPNATGLLPVGSGMAKFRWSWRTDTNTKVRYSRGLQTTLIVDGRPVDEEVFPFASCGLAFVQAAPATPKVAVVSVGIRRTLESPAIIWDSSEHLMWWHDGRWPARDALCGMVSSYLAAWVHSS